MYFVASVIHWTRKFSMYHIEKDAIWYENYRMVIHVPYQYSTKEVIHRLLQS